MGASASQNGLGSAEAPEPHSGLRPSDAIPRAAHTPLPWRIAYGFDLGLARAPATYVAAGERAGIKLASPWIEGAWDNDPEADANAAFIVRACNSHYELVEALEATLFTLREYMGDYGMTPDSDEPALLEQADAALAKARGEQ